MGVIFDVDHDFKGPRAPKAHLDTVLTKTVTPPAQAPYLHEGAQLLNGGRKSAHCGSKGVASR